MATQLSDLYVTITAQGLAETMAELRKVKEELAAAKKPAAEMEGALGRLGQMAMAQMGPLGMLTAGVSALWKMFREVPQVKVPVLQPAKPPVLPRADGIPVLNPAGGGGGGGGGVPAIGGMSAGAMAGIGAAIAITAVAAHHLIGAIGSAKDQIIGLARAGFEGTVEMNRYQFAMQQVGRGVAGAFVPVLNVLTSVLQQVSHALNSMGGTGQKVLAATVVGIVLLTSSVTALTIAVAALVVIGSPVAVVFFAIAGAMAAVGGAIYLAWTHSKAFRDAVLTLKAHLGALLTALEPVGAALLKVGGFLAMAFVIEPLIAFLNALTVIVMLLEKAVKYSMLLKILPKDSLNSPRKDVTLNQTGEESAAGSFQRIQQSILKYETPEESEDKKQSDTLNRIEAWLDRNLGGSESKAPTPPSPGSLVQGSTPGGGVLGDVARSFFGGR